VDPTGGSVTPDVATTDAAGQASFIWTPGVGASPQLRITVEGAPEIAPVTVSAAPARVMAAVVVNTASLAAGAAPGMLGSIWGENLGGINATVTLGGRPLMVTGGDESRLDFYIPLDTPLGPSSLVIANQLGSSAPVPVNVTAVAPGIFADGLDRPVQAGGSIDIQATGLGLNPEQAQVSIGGEVTYVSSNAPAPGLVGINLLTVQVPQDLAAGTQTLYLTIQDAKSNEVQIGVE
jgi:uncharacterized protein (TIGR03437 family)